MYIEIRVQWIITYAEIWRQIEEHGDTQNIGKCV